MDSAGVANQSSSPPDLQCQGAPLRLSMPGLVGRLRVPKAPPRVPYLRVPGGGGLGIHYIMRKRQGVIITVMLIILLHYLFSSVFG